MLEYIGWLGVLFGLFVAPSQLWKIWRSKEVRGISKTTYIMLLATMLCMLVHAIDINDLIFTITYGINLIVNGAVFVLMIKYDEKTSFWEDLYYRIGGR